MTLLPIRSNRHTSRYFLWLGMILCVCMLVLLSACSSASSDSAADQHTQHQQPSPAASSTASQTDTTSGHRMSHGDMSSMAAPEGSSSTTPDQVTTDPQIVNGKEVTLTAQASNLEVEKGKYVPVWTFNNSVPGPQIQVTEGDTVTVHLKNKLDVPVTIHFHGVVLPNAMDGVPGVTQDAVQPGKTFTYTFQALHAGTYWYHSHQDSLNQIGRGLYGTFVVHPKKTQTDDLDRTFVLAEWNDPHTHPADTAENTTALNSNMGAYNLYTINGRSGNRIDPLYVNTGQQVRLRFVNAGNMTHLLYLPLSSYQIVSTDGEDIYKPQKLSNGLLRIAPGERYDLVFTAIDQGITTIGAVGDSDFARSMRLPVVVSAQGQKPNVQQVNEEVSRQQQHLTTTDVSGWQVLDLMTYGQPSASTFTLNQNYDRQYDLKLSMGVSNGKMAYTINDEAYADLKALTVRTGDTVKITLSAPSGNEDHPMHLHGHVFQVLSRNGKTATGSPVWKDTLNVRPGETYEIAVRANNPGNWMLHCHELHHASMGMMIDFNYEDFQSPYQPDQSIDNISE
ncbi:multicopper oxidase family protein [Paenibacillus kandeliae]|uniref:multicopper oxidase family protein n=1 Tax=Paenibacillus kandeliae TaxID=3231269 RepID=UPI00345AFD60